VREKVFSTLRLFVDRLEKIAAGIKPDTADDTAAAEKESAGMLGWLSRRIYGGADGAPARIGVASETSQLRQVAAASSDTTPAPSNSNNYNDKCLRRPMHQ
jgi:hypothetical protein